MNDENAYWDNLGVAWRASSSDIQRVTPLLQARLRRQAFGIGISVTLGLPLCVAALVLGILTIWHGWTAGIWNFVTRGTAIVLISALLIRALTSFLPFRARTGTQSLADMLEIASARIRRTLFLIGAAIAACVISAAFGLAGAALRIHAGSPPHLSPFIDLAIIALIIAFLWLYARTLSAEADKFEYLQRTLAADR
ncbi:MAG TPA: hypothetical protein VFA99_05550 [Acidobacteriaceae bacterium]|nr:hypothetical protein [Acidobacteriaceae bacterium]